MNNAKKAVIPGLTIVIAILALSLFYQWQVAERSNAGLTQDLAQVQASLDWAFSAQQEAENLRKEAERQAAKDLGEETERRQAVEQLNVDLSEDLAQAKASLDSALGAQQAAEDLRKEMERQAEEDLEEEVERRQDAERSNEVADVQTALDTALEAQQAVEDLREEAERLRAEIAALEAKLAPLIIRAEGVTRTYIACTGSMEPTMTCLDEADLVDADDPSEITVGAIIAFEPDCQDGPGAAHRVVDVRVEDGQYYFWPQGDANGGPDGCWVPAENVWGYLVALHKNTQPENAPLREYVNAARAEHDGAVAQREAAWADYASLLAQPEYCGDTPIAQCQLPEPQYSTSVEAYALVEARTHDAERAYDVWACWLDVAGEAEYPGHIPRHCGDAVVRER